MIYYLAQYFQEQVAGTPWEDTLSWLRLFRYITVRSAGATITALVLSWWLGPMVIRWLKRVHFTQEYDDRAQLHGNLIAPDTSKRGVPSMGGLLIVPIMNFTALLWAQWNTLVQLTLLSAIGLMGLGFYDDYIKLTRQDSRGIASKVKLAVQFALGLFIAWYLWQLPLTHQLIAEVMVPFVKEPLPLGAAGVGVGFVITILTIVGSSNAVNLSDGLDGLAIGCTLIVTGVFVVLAYVAGHSVFARYLYVPYVPGAGELTVYCAGMIGAGLGFLWYNCYPAEVFMGDTGSLALGGSLGIIAVCIHQPLVLVIAGGVFVAEAVSVILQTLYFKHTRRRYGQGRRLFRMAPVHHHFQKLGWHETKVVMRFYIVAVLCALLALSTLKIR